MLWWYSGSVAFVAYVYEDAGLVIISRVQKIKVCCCFNMGRLIEGTDP